MGHRGRDLGIRHEGRTSHRELVQDDSEPVEIRPRVGFLASALLGREVGDRPEDRARRGDVVRGERGFGDPEVGNLQRPVVGDENVSRFHVTVDDAVPVGVGERVADAATDGGYAFRRQRTLVAQEVFEGPSPTVLHHDVLQIGLTARGFGTGVVDRDDVGMRQSSRGQRLSPESLQERVVLREVRMQDLDGDGPRQHVIARLPDRCHAAFRDVRLQDVAPGDRVEFWGHVEVEVRLLPGAGLTVHGGAGPLLGRPDPLDDQGIGHARQSDVDDPLRADPGPLP